MNQEQLKRKQTVIWTGVALILALLLYILSPVLTPFMLGLAIAYVMAPGVRYMHQVLRFPRPLAVGLALIFLLFLIFSIFLVVFPLLRRELLAAVAQSPVWIDYFNQHIAPELQSLLGVNAQINSNEIITFLHQTVLGDMTGDLSDYIRHSTSTIITIAITILLTPIVVIYLLLDWDNFVHTIHNAIPRRFLPSVEGFAKDANALLSSYLRGQILVMLILSVYYSVGLMIAGFENAIAIGSITGMLVFIPYVGFGIGLILAIISGILQFQSYFGILAVAIVYGIGQVLEGMVLTPNIMGNRIGLHPLVIIFSVFIFGQLFGFFGVLLALPLCATASVLIRRVYSKYQKSTFYTDLS